MKCCFSAKKNILLLVLSLETSLNTEVREGGENPFGIKRSCLILQPDHLPGSVLSSSSVDRRCSINNYAAPAFTGPGCFDFRIIQAIPAAGNHGTGSTHVRLAVAYGA